MVTFTTSMIIAVICIIIGLGTGIFVAMAFSRGGESRKPAAGDDPYEPVAVLLRDPRDQTLLAEIDGRLYASAEPLNDGQRETLEKTARDMYAWLRLPPEPEPAPVQAAVPPRPAAAPSKTMPLPAAPYAERIRPEPVLPAAPVPPAADKKQPVKARSIVQQIDEILQDMVAGTPLAEKSIRLVEEPNQGVIVWIGLEHFEGINSVPDIEARTIIQAAVREWEKKSEAAVK